MTKKFLEEKIKSLESSKNNQKIDSNGIGNLIHVKKLLILKKKENICFFPFKK